MKNFSSLSVGLLLGFAALTDLRAQTNWQGEWEKTLAAAKQEGKAVVGIPPSTELRKALETAFKPKFGFELELFPATGPQIANRVVTEGKAGVRYFDTFIFGSCTGVPLIKTGLFEPAENYMILPEVKDRKTGGAATSLWTT